MNQSKIDNLSLELIKPMYKALCQPSLDDGQRPSVYLLTFDLLPILLDCSESYLERLGIVEYCKTSISSKGLYLSIHDDFVDIIDDKINDTEIFFTTYFNEHKLSDDERQELNVQLILDMLSIVCNNKYLALGILVDVQRSINLLQNTDDNDFEEDIEENMTIIHNVTRKTDC